jgi:hypothetical protein
MCSFSVVKSGNEEAENEDAAFFDPGRGLLAVADGATEASYARVWARRLAPAWGAAGRYLGQRPRVREDEFQWFLAALQRRWYRDVPWDRLARDSLFERKAKQGAFATFLGVRLFADHWTAFAVGDCNLFVLSVSGAVSCAWPHINVRELRGTAPVLIPSVIGPATKLAWERAQQTEGVLGPGEQLIIATDAVSEHLLYEVKGSGPTGAELLAVQTQAAFEEWVVRARAAGMRNDDATVVRVAREGERGDGVAAAG